MKYYLPIIALLVILLANINPVNADETINPYKTEIPPIIDGLLNDDVWQKAPFVTGFKTFTPDFGIDMVEKTEAYVAYDRENLYFAFRCYDSQPDKIKTSITSRDNIRPDDWVCINLDSYNDQQSLYALYINPMGIQADSRFASGKEDHSLDLIWFSEGRIDESGYTIEVRVPFKSIRFTNKNPVEMAVIFERKISRRSEQGTFPALKPERGMAFLTQMTPMNFYDIKHYTLFELLPSVTYGKQSAIDRGKLVSSSEENDLSLTTKYGITSNLILDGTINPDFSQIEADAGQVDVNLRYALFFPEKRPFFLEGRENFNFAGSSHSDPLISVVHTRMIANPLIGTKLSGKISENSTIATIYSLDELPDDNDDKYAHFSILRYKRALNEDSYVGGIYTGRELKNHFNRVFGIDGQSRITESSMLGYHGFTSQSQDSSHTPESKGYALGLTYSYNTRKLNINAGAHNISKNFNTETGYLLRTGISKLRLTLSPKFYPKINAIRRIDPSFSSSQTKDNIDNLYETSNSASLRFVLWRNSNITFSYRYATEIFLSKKFDTGNFNISGSSQFTRKFYFRLSYRNGKSIRYIADPYQGRGSRATASIIYQPSDKLSSNLNFTYTDFFKDSDSEKIYDYTIMRGKVTYQLNRYLFFRGLSEYNSFRKNLFLDFLASFTYIPGTVVHLGYGSVYEKIRWQREDYITSNSFLETKRGVFFKTSYLWRL